jgi:hypothetical protein
MNEFDDAVRDLLSQSPPQPALKNLERRARHRRVRRRATLAGLAVLIVVAAVTAAGATGHSGGGPQIAVSPTTSDVATSKCVLHARQDEAALKASETELEASEAELTRALAAAQRDHAPNADSIDAQHQAVLRQIADVSQRILDVQLLRGVQPDLNAATPPAESGSCPRQSSTSDPAGWCSQLRALDDESAQLEALEPVMNKELSVALAAHASIAGLLDAQHIAVLRELSDIQQHILRLAQSNPTGATCSQQPGASTQPATSTTVEGSTSTLRPTVPPQVFVTHAVVHGAAGGPPPCASGPTGDYWGDAAHPEHAPLQQSASFGGGRRWALCGASDTFNDNLLNLRSVDDGATWDVVVTPIGFSPRHAGDFIRITLDDATTGRVALSSLVTPDSDMSWITHDGGQTWTKQ